MGLGLFGENCFVLHQVCFILQVVSALFTFALSIQCQSSRSKPKSNFGDVSSWLAKLKAVSQFHHSLLSLAVVSRH